MAPRRRAVLPSLLALLALLSANPAASAAEQADCKTWDVAGHASPEVMEIRLSGEVGPDMARRLFAEIDGHLATYPTLKTIKIQLSSDGGHVDSGIMMHNYLKGLHQRLALQVVTHNVGSVQSAAVDLYCAGNQRVTSPYTYFMVHDGNFDLGDGNYDVKEVRDMDEENTVLSEASYALFSACTNLTVDDAGRMYRDQTYIDPDQSLELGLAHSIQPATFDRSADIRCQIHAEDDDEDVEE